MIKAIFKESFYSFFYLKSNFIPRPRLLSKFSDPTRALLEGDLGSLRERPTLS